MQIPYPNPAKISNCRTQNRLYITYYLRDTSKITDLVFFAIFWKPPFAVLTQPHNLPHPQFC
jgi:hypothetical protein